MGQGVSGRLRKLYGHLDGSHWFPGKGTDCGSREISVKPDHQSEGILSKSYNKTTKTKNSAWLSQCIITQ